MVVLVVVIAAGVATAVFQLGLPWWMDDGDRNHVYESDAGSQRYQVHLPPNHDGSTRLPVIMAIHGCGMTGYGVNSMKATTQFNRLADREGFIVNNTGGRLQGYGVNAVTGRINEGVPTDLKVDTRAANPNRTTEINSTLNLNSGNVRPAGAQNAYDKVFQDAYDGAYGAPDPADAAAATGVGAEGGAGSPSGSASLSLDPTVAAPVAIREVTWLNLYEGLYHETHNEPERERVAGRDSPTLIAPCARPAARYASTVRVPQGGGR